jgi:cytoskeletal protein CcmA (bactofilin family)
VEADIDCGVVSIRGSVTGRVCGRQRVELLAGARVQGTLVSPRLVIEEGAIFSGDCDMGATAPAAGNDPSQRGLR